MSDPSSPIEWTADGTPRSAVFDDIYFQPGEGLAEARAVFLAGCGLPQAWRGRSRFVVAELGFGTGLNVLALLDLWRREREPGQRLHVFSLEAHPLTAPEARLALAAWPELSDLAEALLEAWPRRAAGFHRIDLPHLDAVVDLAIGDARVALSQWRGEADAWMLDGFSPAKNPDMWSAEVLALVAARSAPGARVATFTVAGQVRRGLAAQGFVVEKHPGHGRKRQRLEARWPGASRSDAKPGRVVVVGGGVAAAALTRALRAQGIEPLLVSDGQQGASANPAALVAPTFDLGERAGARLSAQALARAFDLYQRTAPASVIARGAAQMEREPRDAARFDALAASRLYEPGALERLDAEGLAERLGEPAGVGGLWIRDALMVDPARAVRDWTAEAARVTARVDRLERRDGRWRLLDADGEEAASADVVVLATGAGLGPLARLPLQLVRGQVSWLAMSAPVVASAWGGYAIPTRDGLLFGATHDRADEDVTTRATDDARNRAQLALGRPRLAALAADRPTTSRAALRATTRDRLPIAGQLETGLLALGGLGGRGFTHAPLLAEHLAALIVGAPSPLPGDLIQAIDPRRLAPLEAAPGPGRE